VIIKVLNYEKYQNLSNYGNTGGNADSKTDGEIGSNTIRKESKEKKNNNISKDITTEVVYETSIIKKESF
jgi:hypothetical protein